MPIISMMSDDPMPLIKFYVRTTPELRDLFQALHLDVRNRPPLRRGRKRMSQELFANALWLMLRDEDPDRLAERLAPYVARAKVQLDEAIPAEDAVTGDDSGENAMKADVQRVVEPSKKGSKTGGG